ncbi:MAG TPA: sigma 54-interacting transcriptional regulator, partial [Ignavibacteriaceae bacterium]|nr:sigma 54-interacting transcriptional regulator [Ignavibacteriaceae bacterium]
MANEDMQKYVNLIELASILGNQNDFDELLRIVSAHVLSLFNADAASIVMINPRTDNTIKTIIRNGKDYEHQRHHFVQTNVVGWVNKNKQPFITTNLKDDSRFTKNLFEASTISSLMCVPLISEGIAIGYVLAINENENKIFNQDNLSFLCKFSAIAAPYLSNIRKIAELFETPLSDSILLPKYEAFGLYGKSSRFKELLKAVESAARCDVRVLLEGESGTGKELIAKAIHQLSKRKDQPFIAVDCGAIPEQLMESEFFGHVKGAFTGAVHDRKGLFEEADRGTLFMDEISNLPIDMQAKLLRVFQENEIRILGSSKIIKADVRIIAASSLPLRDLVENQKFREDLYYRLHVYPIYVPSLNQRREDIPCLAAHFLNKFAKEQNNRIESFSLSMIKFLQNRNWEGNIRELENFIERLVTLSPEGRKTIDTNAIPKEYLDEYKRITRNESVNAPVSSLEKSLEDFEKELIKQTLIDNNWNQSKAARVL